MYTLNIVLTPSDKNFDDNVLELVNAAKRSSIRPDSFVIDSVQGNLVGFNIFLAEGDPEMILLEVVPHGKTMGFKKEDIISITCIWDG